LREKKKIGARRIVRERRWDARNRRGEVSAILKLTVFKLNLFIKKQLGRVRKEREKEAEVGGRVLGGKRDGGKKEKKESLQRRCQTKKP